LAPVAADRRRRDTTWSPRVYSIRRCRLLLTSVALLALVACASSPPPPDRPALALPSLMGTWYVIAHVPYFTERGHVQSRDEYTLRPDGRIDVHYVYRTGFHAAVKSLDATASVIPGTGNRDWRLRFFRVVPATQRILEVAPDGRWMLLATPDGDLAWIFSRTPDMDGKTYQAMLEKLRGYGINSDKVWRIAHEPGQVGALGFERPNDE
jgi:apolipoprotein D and lipocalin family protein